MVRIRLWHCLSVGRTLITCSSSGQAYTHLSRTSFPKRRTQMDRSVYRQQLHVLKEVIVYVMVWCDGGLFILLFNVFEIGWSPPNCGNKGALMMTQDGLAHQLQGVSGWPCSCYSRISVRDIISSWCSVQCLQHDDRALQLSLGGHEQKMFGRPFSFIKRSWPLLNFRVFDSFWTLRRAGSSGYSTILLWKVNYCAI